MTDQINQLDTLSTQITTAQTLSALRAALIDFEAALEPDDDTENMLHWHGVSICELPNFGGNAPDDTTGVWAWDTEDLLVGEGPFVDWKIVPRR